MHIIQEHPQKMVWYAMCGNPSDTAMNMVRENFQNITGPSASGKWIYLSSNPNSKAIDILREHQENIIWDMFSKNPGIFELDYDFLRRRMNLIRDELMGKTWHPSRFEEWCL